MNIIKIITSFIVVLLLATGVWYGITQSVKQSQYQQVESIETVFVDQEGMRLRAFFDPASNLATIYFEEFQTIELAQVESALGSRYENEDFGLVFWTSGEEASLYQYDELIFTNSITDAISDESDVQLDITTPSDEEIQSYKWIWKETQMNDGTITTPRNKAAFTLTFGANGNLSGTTDCNGFGGSYSLNQGEITFGPFMQTLMYCEGSQESEFVRMVTDSNSYIFDQDNNLVLLIKYDSGSVLFEKGEEL